MLRLPLLLLSLTVVAWSADLSGKWVGRSQIPSDRQDGMPGVVVDGIVLDLQQTGNELSGTYTGPHEKPVKLQFGRLDSDHITIWFHNSRNVLVTGNLMLKDGWIRGRLHHVFR